MLPRSHAPACSLTVLRLGFTMPTIMLSVMLLLFHLLRHKTLVPSGMCSPCGHGIFSGASMCSGRVGRSRPYTAVCRRSSTSLEAGPRKLGATGAVHVDSHGCSFSGISQRSDEIHEPLLAGRGWWLCPLQLDSSGITHLLVGFKLSQVLGQGRVEWHSLPCGELVETQIKRQRFGQVA